MEILGIDIGGTGIKGAPVNCRTGKLLAERLRIETPKSATPANVAGVVAELMLHFKWRGAVGCTLPSVVLGGKVMTAANIDKKWIGVNAAQLFKARTKRPFVVLNDAAAAALAETRIGAGKGRSGLVMMVTLGTGIGTGMVFNGALIPNCELGHLEISGKDAEMLASNRVREEKDLSWKKWSKRLNLYLSTLESLVWPELFIIGGGVVKDGHKFIPKLSLNAAVLPARLGNNAGIIGAALAAADQMGKGA